MTDCAAGLDLDDHLRVDHEIGEILSDEGSVFVSDLDLEIRVDVEPELSESVCEGVLVDLLQKSGLKGIAGLRRTRFVGRWKTKLFAEASAAAYNLLRLTKLRLDGAPA